MAKSGVTRRKRKGFLSTIPAGVRDELRGAVRTSAALVVATQRALAPVDDGDLRDSITFGMGDDPAVPYAVFKAGGGGDPDLTAVVTAGNSEVRYAHIIEFGQAAHPQGGKFAGTQHPGTPPRPFFLPGYKLARGGVKKLMRKAIRDGATKATRKG